MDQLKDYADDRLFNGCLFCGVGAEETRDHVPSRVFLDRPYPDNLPVVPACFSCNNSFSQDEAYVACLIECILAGSTDPDQIQRPNISKMLRRSPALRSLLESAKSVVDGQTFFTAEEARVKAVMMKLARGHAAYELSWPLRHEPISIVWRPITTMAEEEKESFDAADVSPLWGEVGSRGMQRVLVTQLKLQSLTGEISTVNLLVNDWVEVQDGRYRYHAIHLDNGITIKILIAEYLACEVTWAF